MASLYADEQFPLSVVELLRNLGHDVLVRVRAIALEESFWLVASGQKPDWA